MLVNLYRREITFSVVVQLEKLQHSHNFVVGYNLVSLKFFLSACCETVILEYSANKTFAILRS